MKIATLIARIFLGLLFLVFGLNGFLHFIPMQPPTGLAGQYMGALFLSHYLVVVFVLEAVGGLLLLINRYVPLALVLPAVGAIGKDVLLFLVGEPLLLVSTQRLQLSAALLPAKYALAHLAPLTRQAGSSLRVASGACDYNLTLHRRAISTRIGSGDMKWV